MEQLFKKIENCNKWIAIHKRNRTNSDFSIEFCNEEIERITIKRNEYQKEFDLMYESNC